MTPSHGIPANLPPTIESWVAADRALADVAVARVTGTGADWAIQATNTVNGRRLEEIEWLHLGDGGLIGHITLLMRPVASAAELLAVIGPALARRGLTAPGPAKAASALGSMPAMQLHMAEKRIMPRLRPRR